MDATMDTMGFYVTSRVMINVLGRTVTETQQHVPQQDALLDTMDNTVTRSAVINAWVLSVTWALDSAWVVRIDTMGSTVTNHAVGSARITSVTETVESA